jgi:hypothetical protein
MVGLHPENPKNFKAMGIIPGNLFGVGRRVFWVVGDGHLTPHFLC